MSRLISAAVSIAGCALLAAGAQAEPNVSFYAGSDITTGDYGLDEDTTILRIPLGANVSAGRATFFIEASYISADGYLAAIQQTTSPSDGALLSGLRSRFVDGEVIIDETERVSGLGDTLLGVSFRLTPEAASYYAGVTLAATAPTGEEADGLGMGEWTGSGSFDLEKRWGRFTLSGSAGAVFLDDDEDVYTIQNELVEEESSYGFGSISAGLDATERMTVRTGFYWTQSVVDSLDDQANASVSAYWTLTEAVGLSADLRAGLTDASPDFGTGVTLIFTPGAGG